MAAELYTTHFGFRERPFSLSPDPAFLYMSKAHTRAFSVLEYGMVTHAPLTVVTGEVGMGKTMLLQALLKQADGSQTIGLISNAQGDRGDLLRWVLNALDVTLPEQTDYVSLFQHFQTFVINEYAAGRRVVLIIDEAQNLGADMLEELRMLTNINSGKDELLQLILTGQPELRDLIARPSMRQFAQRITVSFHLEPFELRDTRAYINHRLVFVGGTGNEISTSAVSFIHAKSGGIPRLVNKFCDLALVYAATSDKPNVSMGTLQELQEDGVILNSGIAPLFLTNRIIDTPEAAE